MLQAHSRGSSRLALLALLLLFLFLLGACAPIVTRTPVLADAATLDQLVGEWIGTYSSTETGRNGDIVFRLRAGTDTAEGEVMMSAPTAADPSRPDVATGPARLDQGASQLLMIRFVVASGNEVRGALAPYRDPACGCELATTFRGQLRGNVMEGSFTSEGSGIFHLPASGRWRVERRVKAE